jgi:hypothetical protein
MVQTIHICGEISERKRRDIGERPYSPGPKRPPGRVFGTSTRHPRHAVKSAAAFLSGGEISERFWRDIGEMGVTLGLEVEIPPACGAYLPRRGWTSRIVGRAESLLAKPSSRMTLAAEFVGRLHGRRWWSTPRGGRPDLGGEVGAFTL